MKFAKLDACLPQSCLCYSRRCASHVTSWAQCRVSSVFWFSLRRFTLCTIIRLSIHGPQNARDATMNQTSTSAKSFGHQQPPSQQQLIPPVCYVNMCFVIVVLHIHCFLAHSVCGTVSGSRYSCPKQCICPVFTAIEATFGSAGNPAAGTTGVLHEDECATYIVPFLTPFVVSLRSLMNIAGEATMNQLLWNRRRALQRNLLGTSELPKLQSRPCKIVNNPLRLRRQHTQHTIT